MALDVIVKNNRLYSNELRKLAKAANQRMVELERRGFKAPAYQSVQARLEAMGRQAKTARGRRFSETGYFENRNQMAQYEAMLRRFMHQETSTIKGYKSYRKDILEGLNERYGYREQGISDDEMMQFWEAMPDDDRDRMYGSDETFIIVSKYLKDKRAGTIRQEDVLSISEIVEKINTSKSLSSALDALGIDQAGYLDYKSSFMGKL